jgi:hypothetical protein
MSMMFILDQLSELYGQPTPAVLKMNNTVFRVFCIWLLTRLKSFVDASRNAQKQPSWAATPTQTGNL